ncbi:MICOS complex subunit MIC27 isoform X1 [Acipenser oxyrinchus oxyrinchus]|uniref:MICOS complex subunit n=1 Tax=Acipenser oxyrinchus oxyrinchus TaxID=40147 RepID=A0AAD8DEX0_ACIOX|nr:MICOS complex subunit MIC27 isoform X1 [Acipenser oxyrinchus oxyrinchus]
MSAKAVKLAAIPAVLGLASFRVYAVKEGKHNGSITPEQLSIYSPPTVKLKYVEEQPGRLQRGFSVVRETVHPFVQRVKGAYASVRNGAMNAVHFGQDTYIYLKDPPPGFLPRVSLISVSGLAGLILARNGSRFKKVMFPLGLAAVGTSVCYPAQAVAAVKVSGKKVYAAGHWANGAVSSLWKPSPAKEAHAKLQSHESASVPVKVPNPDVVKGFDTPEVNAVPMPEVVPHVPEAVPDHTIETEVLSAEEAAPQDHLPASEPVDAALLEPAPVLNAVPHSSSPAELPASPESSSPPEAEQPATTKSHESLSQQKELEALPEPSIPVSSSSETPTDLSEKPTFSPDPRLLDHGQSNPEDSDMYSTRS